MQEVCGEKAVHFSVIPQTTLTSLHVKYPVSASILHFWWKIAADRFRLKVGSRHSWLLKIADIILQCAGRGEKGQTM
jgi:hypothetical protein